MENRPGYGVSDYFPDKITHQVFFSLTMQLWVDLTWKKMQYMSCQGSIFISNWFNLFLITDDIQADFFKLNFSYNLQKGKKNWVQKVQIQPIRKPSPSNGLKAYQLPL